VRILVTVDPELPVPPKLYGGIERIVDELVSGLVDRGYKVALVAHPDSSSPAQQRYTWPGPRSQVARDVAVNTIALARAAREFRPDIVHSFSRIMFMAPLLALRIPKIMSYQRSPSRRTVAWGARLSRGSLTFTGCSEHICQLGRALGGSWQRIHNCVELSKYTFRQEVPDAAPLVFLSRVERIKGAHTAIRAARRAGRRLIIAGNHMETGEEGRYWRDEILPEIGRNGVEYVGTVDDSQKNDLLGSAAAMIVPIEWDEPFGIVFAEALACGTPVISCPRGALPEIVRSGVEGFLVRDEDMAVDAIARLKTISRRSCRQRVESCFSNTIIVDEYVHLYKSRVDATTVRS
jgi:glycosyltransferase involved in cell wall biosynthesis